MKKGKKLKWKGKQPLGIAKAKAAMEAIDKRLKSLLDPNRIIKPPKLIPNGGSGGKLHNEDIQSNSVKPVKFRTKRKQ